jgi:hypothetical protein
MLKKMGLWIAIVVCSLNLSGCVFLLGAAAVGVVGGVGTAKWLSDKLVEEVRFPYDRTVQGVRDGLKDLQLEISKVTATDETTQIISAYSDGRTVWVVVDHISSSVSRIQVRVGVWGGQPEARKILDGIMDHLK